MNSIRNRKLHRLLRVYFTLRSKRMQAYHLAQGLGVTVRTVERYLNDLVDAGIIINTYQKKSKIFYRIDPKLNSVDLI